MTDMSLTVTVTLGVEIADLDSFVSAVAPHAEGVLRAMGLGFSDAVVDNRCDAFEVITDRPRRGVSVMVGHALMLGLVGAVPSGTAVSVMQIRPTAEPEDGTSPSPVRLRLVE